MNNFRIPEVDKDMSVIIKTTFVVEPDGSVSNVKTKNDSGYGFAEEVIRVMQNARKDLNPER
jgi:protein TonB